ncbi:MAG TPA: PIN domain-containing protein [Chthonomonadaceae bacterium]|nr:PIN domain-containing protein [Chthonomonadaceae bacterium]
MTSVRTPTPKIQAVVLDTGPLGEVTKRRGHSAGADACRKWLEGLLRAGIKVYVPEIADYELRRELLRTKKTDSVRRLDTLKARARYLSITEAIMLKAADLWATARNRGFWTADPKALDGDVILAASVLSLGFAPRRVI